MKQTVNGSQFVEQFHVMGGAAQFSQEAWQMLFEHIESIEDATGVETELDVVAVCCDYREETLLDIALDYSIDIDGLDDEEIECTIKAFLMNSTLYIGETEHGLVYAAF